MNIGINICGRSKKSGENHADFVVDCFNKLAIEHPEHSFIFINDRGFDYKAANVKNIPIKSGLKQKLFGNFLFGRALKKTIKKQQIDLLINLEITSFKTIIPQLLWMNDLPVYKRNNRIPLQEVKRIAAVSDFLKNEIISQYKIDAQKIDIVYRSIDKKYAPVFFEEKENTKEKYTEGKEYFLYTGAINADKNLIMLLKAFSFFKKRQKSNMQLLIVSESLIGNEFEASLKTYKYREEVKLLLDLPLNEQVKIMASAYAFVSPSLHESFPVKLIEAMQCDVPVIANDMDVITETCGDSVLYTNANSFEDIADKMMLLFKDENKRNDLIAKGNSQALQYSIDKTAHLLWQSIVKTTPV
jgi:glycosyltransferase involved in cell wall biosynthesis